MLSEPPQHRTARPEHMSLLDRLARPIASFVATPAVHFVALLGLCAAYIQGGLDKLLDFNAAIAEAQHFRLPFATAAACATIVTELAASALILTGAYRWLGALRLAGFTLVATFLHVLVQARPTWKITASLGLREATLSSQYLPVFEPALLPVTR